MAVVTIVMPTFQRADYVRHAIDSALAQTFDDFALSIGDNSRTDEIQDVVCSYDDPRIVYHRNAEDIGGQANWLAIVDRAETPLVASLHDDDAWHPDFLAKVVPPMLEHPDVGMTFADFCVMDADGMPLPELTAELSIRTRRDCLDTGRLDLDRAAGLRLVAVWNAAAASDRSCHPSRVHTAHRVPPRNHPAVRHLDLVPDGAARRALLLRSRTIDRLSLARQAAHRGGIRRSRGRGVPADPRRER